MEQVREVSTDHDASKDFKTAYELKKEKLISLYQARKVLSIIGTMEERKVAARNLKQMRKAGIFNL